MEKKELGYILSEVKFSNVRTNPGLTGSDRVPKGSLIHPGCSEGEPSNGTVQAPVTVFYFPLLFFHLKTKNILKGQMMVLTYDFNKWRN